MADQRPAVAAVQLQADNPDLVFVVPESGGTTFVDTMVIPYTTQNQNAAEAWINYVYDRVNYAKLVAFVPPNCTWVTVLRKLPVIVTAVPPAAGPLPGEIDETTGGST